MRGFRITPVAVLFVVVTGCSGLGRESSNVVIALPSSTLLAASAFVAEDLDLFQQEGLQITVRTVVGVGSVNAVLAGSADFTIGTGPTFLQAASKGQSFVAIANVIDRPLVEIVLHREVGERLDVSEELTLDSRGRRLRGLTIAIQGVGSVVHAWVRYVATAGGLDVERDLRIAPMDPPAMVAALRNRLIDGFATSPPFTTQAVLDGDAVMLASGLSDAPDLLPFAYALLYAKPETCAERRHVCARLASAFATAARRIHDEPDVVLERVIRKRFATMDDELLEAAWARARAAHAVDIRVTEQHLANSMKVSLGAKFLDPASAFTRYSGLYTQEFVP